MRGSGRRAATPPVGVRPPLARELILGLAVFAIYAVMAGLDWAGREAAAARHAESILRIEAALHIDIERPLNQWLVQQPDAVRTIANYEYAITYVISAFVLLFWVYAKRPGAYRWARTSFVVLNIIGLACFAIYPLMPPRLLPASHGYVDTVMQGHTWGSWGSPLVEHANTVAAMPSLHVAWALWVSVLLAYVAGGPRVQALSAVHVVVTVFVIVATANHYLLDAAGAAALVGVSVLIGRKISPRPDVARSRLVPGADAFFLHVEDRPPGRRAAPQQVGGVALLDTDAAGRVGRAEAAKVISRALPELPRFRQVLTPGTGWRRPRWIDVPVDDIDFGWHVQEMALGGGDPREEDLDRSRRFRELVARFAETPLPRDRPLWRLVVVPDVAPGRAGVMLVVHHVIADGIGTVAQAVKLLEPPVSDTAPDIPCGPGLLKRVAAVTTGLAQLATDGRTQLRLPGCESADRAVSTFTVPFDRVRECAQQHGARATDVLLSAVAGAISRTVPTASCGAPLRIAVPMMIRRPGAGSTGNFTAAVIIGLPCGPGDERERLRQVAAATRRLRTPTRALASRFVMTAAGRVLPPPAHRWFAQTVYGGRFFQGIVSNMPGPNARLHMMGAPLLATYPVLPLAPGAPFALGALGWDGKLCVSLVTDPGVLADGDELAAQAHAIVEELAAGPRHSSRRIDVSARPVERAP